MKRLLIHIILYCTFWGSCLAQLPQDFLFRFIGNEDQRNGLSQTTNHFIYKDSKGFVWISSLAGLNRFDGKQVKIYEEIIGDTTSLQGQFVQGRFSENGQSNIWFTTYRALHYYDRKKDSFQHFSLTDSLGLSIPGFYNCGMDKDQQLWIIHQDSLYLFDTKQQSFSEPTYLDINIFRGELLKDSNGQVTHFYAYAPGQSDFWIISDPTSERAIKKHFSLNKTESISSVLPEQDSLIWIATNKGLAKFNPLTEEYHWFTNNEQGAIDKLLGMTSYSDQYLALSSHEKGLLFFNKNTLQFLPQTDSSMLLSSKGPIYKSEDGGLWLSIEGKGVAYTSPEEIKFNKYLTSDLGGYNGVQLSFNKLLDVGNSEIWAATYSNGIFVLDDNKKIIRQITKELHPEIGSDLIIHLLKDDQNRIWILTWGGLSFYDLNTKEFKNISKDHIFLYAHQSSNGKVLLCSYSQNGIWEISEDYSLRRVDPNTTAKYTFLYEDQTQNLYAARNLTSLEIFKQDIALIPVSTLPLQGDIKTAYEGSNVDSSIWFGTTNGLIKLNKASNDFDVYSRKDGLASSTIYSIISDSKNNFWLSTNTGISCFNPSSLEYQNYGLMEGLSAIEFNSFSYFKKSNNEIWFGSTNGLTTFNPERFYTNSPPKVEITEILINDEIQPDLKCQQTQAINPEEIKAINLPYSQNTLSFSFSALEYAHPENVRLQYQMQGIDEDWINAKKDGFIRYAKLRHGIYTLQLRASTSIGLWSSARQIKIMIEPPFYYTWWFILCCMSFFAMLIFSYLNYKEKRQKKEQQKLENQRNEFAQDMHDELGSSISSLKLSIELLKSKVASGEIKQHLEKIAISSQNLYQKLREVIWAVNSRNDTLENLILYLHEYALETFEDTTIEYQPNIPASIPHYVIRDKRRSNILFSFKEAINNSIRHAEASQVSITFIIHSDSFDIQIEDNGKGISPDFLDQSPGIGLENMQRRFHEIGGTCVIKPGSKGTTILFSTKTK